MICVRWVCYSIYIRYPVVVFKILSVFELSCLLFVLVVGCLFGVVGSCCL